MKKENGFTLVELLIVVVIVGILAAIVFPSYQEHIIKTRRVSAQSALQGLAQALEQHYITNGTYAGAASNGVPTIFSTKAPIDGSEIFYNLKIASAGVSSYIIGAEPVGTQAGDGIVILNSTGARGWDRDDDSNGILSSPFTVESTEQCWKKSC